MAHPELLSAEFVMNHHRFLLAKQMQFHNSLHYLGENFGTANRTQCAVCHTHEGFRESLTTKLDTTLAVIPNPTGPNCRT